MKNKELFDTDFLMAVFNQLYTNVYITDIETDEIVYMIDMMKKTYSGPELIQGYYFGRPMKPEEFEERFLHNIY